MAFARDLVNEPANSLGPVEFAEQLKGLSKLGVEVKVLGDGDLRKQKMGALLGVAQGSERPPRVVVMRWKGGRQSAKPIAFVGKGVVFDTGGISIKPAAGMEDMKGDMGGAAAVSGLMRTLALRKAKVNAVGIVGPGREHAGRQGATARATSSPRCRARRSKSINTDAEGRLVLADLLTYVQKTDQPAAMIDLATLTGAIFVALGNQYAGLFSNNDALAEELPKPGRRPASASGACRSARTTTSSSIRRFADMKNIGGRNAGVDNRRAVHPALCGEGHALGASRRRRDRHGLADERDQQSWGSGWGVRLLDEFVRARFERRKS